MKATTRNAQKLLLEGSLALAEIEHNGIRVDEEYLDKAIADATIEIDRIEEELKTDDVYKTWKKKYKKPKLGSPDELGDVIFGELGYECKIRTGKKKAPAVTEEAFKHVKLPFIEKFFKAKKLRKAKQTYLVNLKREIVDGFFHPIYNLHIARTYRSSAGKDKEDERTARDFNFQNIPSRNEAIAKIIRTSFIPRKGRWILEADLSNIEVKTACPYTKDPKLIEYMSDPKNDMHRDVACQLFFLKHDKIDWKANKPLRQAAKGPFVFAQFYGDWWHACARKIWDYLINDNIKLKTDGKEIDIFKWLKQNGIRGLGTFDPMQDKDGEPADGTFQKHVKDIEYDFWNKRFKVYKKWKDEQYEAYLNRGWFDTFTGFRFNGVFAKKEFVNYSIQGTAFHCLLRSLIKVIKIIRKRKMKTLLIGQIHDSMLLDVPNEELDDIIELVTDVMTKQIPNEWDWINVPIWVEIEGSKNNWFEKSAKNLENRMAA